MNRKIATAVAAGLAAIGSATTIGLATTGVAGAATPPAGVSTTTHTGALLEAHHRRLIRAVIVISAQTLNMTPSALVAQLRTGKSIADVATAQGVNPQTVVNALVTRGDAKVTQLQADGKISAAQAAKLTSELPTLAAKVVQHVFGQQPPSTGSTAG